jgi:hypothetical protein
LLTAEEADRIADGEDVRQVLGARLYDVMKRIP